MNNKKGTGLIKKNIVRSIILIITFCYFATHGGEVAIAGSLINHAFTIFDDPGDNADHIGPAVAYNSQTGEYLVVWYNDRLANYNIIAQRISSQGEPVGPWFTIADSPGFQQLYPEVAYNSNLNEYLIVWYKYKNSGSVDVQRVSANGQLIGSPINIVSNCSFQGCSQFAVAYNSVFDKYLLIVEFTGPDMWIRLSSLCVAEYGEYYWNGENFDVAYNRSGIFSTRLQGDGTPIWNTIIEVESVDQKYPSIAAIPTIPNHGQYLIVWEHHAIPVDRDIHGRRLSGDGNLIGSKLIIGDLTTDESSPAVAGSEASDQYLVAWRDAASPTSVIKMQEVSLSGNSINGGTSSAGADQNHPAVASGQSGDFLVAFDASTIDTGIYGQLWGNYRQFLPLTFLIR
jgi:hypothetical protein